MNREIFINCPFDDNYSELFDAVLFAIYFCGCKPRCALEIDDGSQVRLDKIYEIIEECDLGIHDISRTELNENNLPRFNMPLEFGIFMGAKRFGGSRQKTKSCLIFDTERYRYMEYISDISGQDIKAHGNDPAIVIRKIRSWLNTFNSLKPIAGATAIIGKYEQYRLDWPRILPTLNLDENDVEYSDRTQIIEEWISLNPL
ncbi:MAG: hypothetical protein RLO12_19985 [Fulvivirga sp.]